MPDEFIYLERALAAFIDVSIQRVAHSGSMIYRYRMTAEEIRSSTGRQRIHDSVIDDVLSFFSSVNVIANYSRTFGVFDITLDLNSCLLNQAQAGSLATAMSYFHTMNT